MDPLHLPPTQPKSFPVASSVLPVPPATKSGGRGEEPGRDTGE